MSEETITEKLVEVNGRMLRHESISGRLICDAKQVYNKKEIPKGIRVTHYDITCDDYLLSDFPGDDWKYTCKNCGTTWIVEAPQ